jgi:hypothetical protein
MTKTFEQLSADAETIRTNNLPDSNTANLVGQLHKDTIIKLQETEGKILPFSGETGSSESAGMTQNAITKELAKKVDKVSIVQETGTNTDKIISQDATTKLLETKIDKTSLVQETGDDADKLMSQAAVSSALKKTGAVKKFVDIVESATLETTSTTQTGDVVYITSLKVFALRVGSALTAKYYGNWDGADEYMNSGRTAILDNNLYIKDGILYYYNGALKCIDTDDYSYTYNDNIASFIRGGYIDATDSVVTTSGYAYIKDADVSAYDIINVRVGILQGGTKSLLMDTNKNILKKFSTDLPSTILRSDYPTLAYISISSREAGLKMNISGYQKLSVKSNKYLADINISDIGEKMREIKYYEVDGGFYYSDLSFSSNTQYNQGYTNLIKCKEGDIFYHRTYGFSGCNNYSVLDSNFNVIAKEIADYRTTMGILTIPANAAWVIFFYTVKVGDTINLKVYTDNFLQSQLDKFIDTYDIETLTRSNVLYGKQYTALGDSFTQANGTETIASGPLKGSSKVYPNIIANRNNMDVLNLGENGGTLKRCIANGLLDKIPSNVNYLTIWYGINDKGSSIPVGTVTDDTTDTAAGCFNYTFRYLITKFPFAKIGVIISAFMDEDRRLIEIAVCERWEYLTST